MLCHSSSYGFFPNQCARAGTGLSYSGTHKQCLSHDKRLQGENLVHAAKNSAVNYILGQYHIWRIQNLIAQLKTEGGEREGKKPSASTSSLHHSPQGGEKPHAHAFTSSSAYFRGRCDDDFIPVPESPNPRGKSRSFQNSDSKPYPVKYLAMINRREIERPAVATRSVRQKISITETKHKRPKLGAGEHDKRFACPFYKKQPQQYRNCSRLTLSRIKDVKQHLQRNHEEPIHCARCYEIFDTKHRRDAHVRGPACQVKQKVDFGGVTAGQEKMLAKRGKRSHTPEQQWFDIYGILFPEQPPPDSPYMDDAWSEGAREYKNFLDKEGSELLAHFLEERGFSIQTPSRVACAYGSGQKIMQEAIEEGFQVLFGRWQRGNSTRDNQEPESDLGLANDSTNDIEQPIITTWSTAGSNLSPATVPHPDCTAAAETSDRQTPQEGRMDDFSSLFDFEGYSRA